MANLLRRLKLLRFQRILLVSSGCVVASLMAPSPTAWSRSPTVADAAKQIVQDVETRYHSAKTLKAIFLESYSEGRHEIRVESGTVYFSRPGRMRGEYQDPQAKFFLTDGKTAWFYVPADHTVTRAPMKESSDWRTPLALLTGKADIARLCSQVLLLKDETPATAGDVTLRCTPRGADNSAVDKKSNPSADLANGSALTGGDSDEIREILMEVDPKTGWLASVVIYQTGGVELQYRFARWEENIAIPELFF